MTTTKGKQSPALVDRLANAGGDDAPQKSALQTIIEKNMPAIERALPDVGLTTERFTRILLTEIRKNPALAQCDPTSVIASAMIAAQLGLEIGGPLGHAYLVPYKRECTFILGYRGIVDLARRSGEIKSIVAREVCANDEFDYSYGLDEELVHRPALTDRGDVIAYYGIAKFKDGGHQLLVMSLEDIEKRRRRSASANASHSPWKSDYDAMARKTVIRAMAPFLPLKAEVFTAMSTDGARPRRIDFDLSDVAHEAGDERELGAGDPDGAEDAVLIGPDGEPIDESEGAGDPAHPGADPAPAAGGTSAPTQPTLEDG